MRRVLGHCRGPKSGAWYNDIEGGFNVSVFPVRGTIPDDEYLVQPGQAEVRVAGFDGPRDPEGGAADATRSKLSNTEPLNPSEPFEPHELFEPPEPLNSFEPFEPFEPPEPTRSRSPVCQDRPPIDQRLIASLGDPGSCFVTQANHLRPAACSRLETRPDTDTHAPRAQHPRLVGPHPPRAGERDRNHRPAAVHRDAKRAQAKRHDAAGANERALGKYEQRIAREENLVELLDGR